MSSHTTLEFTFDACAAQWMTKMMGPKSEFFPSPGSGAEPCFPEKVEVDKLAIKLAGSF